MQNEGKPSLSKRLSASLRKNERKVTEEATIDENKSKIKYFKQLGIDTTSLLNEINKNEELRSKSENFLYEFLCAKFSPSKVRWLNKVNESYLDHDFEILDEAGNIQNIIECKGTESNKPTFYMTSKEWNCFLANKEIYQVYRIFDIATKPDPMLIDNLLSWILKGYVVPYAPDHQALFKNKIVLTIINSPFMQNGS